jgi:thioredoxin 1
VASKSISVEFFFAAGCSKCVEAREALRKVAQATPRIDWREIDIAKNPHRAVEVGVISTPAVAIDGELLFKSMPTVAALRKAIEARARKT